ncbi:MAG: biotin--[Lachnospiraceae bacterium]|nr:biotin--[acetyl-CoA-carboxylase] ligase [Lachnospiraceae bacterium]
MKNKILARLSDADDFVSGQELCNEFGVSRTAVWKAVNRLKKEGYNIESVTNRGYRLRPGSDIMSESEIRRFLKTDTIGNNVIVYDECDSTNNRVAQASFEGAQEGLVIVAYCQTLGRGRRGRSWQSPGGVSVYMSVLLKPAFAPEYAPQVTLVAALAVSSAIDELVDRRATEVSPETGVTETVENLTKTNLTESVKSPTETGLTETGESLACTKAAGESGNPSAIRTRIKWPNDIVMNGRKVCGILTELDCQMDYINNLVVGIGINVFEESFPDDIADKAGSIFSVTGLKISRNQLVVAVCSYFEKYYNIFLQTCDLTNLVDIYNEKLINKDREVRVLDPKGEFEGVAKGITDEGRLIVETGEGARYVSSGEVSVRGLYGYV